MVSNGHGGLQVKRYLVASVSMCTRTCEQNKINTVLCKQDRIYFIKRKRVHLSDKVELRMRGVSSEKVRTGFKETDWVKAKMAVGFCTQLLFPSHPHLGVF